MSRSQQKSAQNQSEGGITVRRVFTSPGVDPFDGVEWETSDVRLVNWRDGSVNFEQSDVEFPQFWSASARQIVTSKYFRGALGTPQRESSLREVISRVAGKYTAEGINRGYFDTDNATIFASELKHMLLHQIFSFNSPVWFNVGTASPQQISACFLLSVEDSMEDILAWYREEGLIFKGGSGAGVNLSKIRSSKELLSSGGTASGPVSFMRGADASAGAIKSGGSTRRAAKLVCLDVDHPDIEEFVGIKAREEEKVRALAAAGFDVDLDGADSYSVQYQNANNSVRVSDEFMRCLTAPEGPRAFGLRSRADGQVVSLVDPEKLWRQIAQAAWDCADPGVQYDDTINGWHTCPEDGRITTSNPCSEYMHLDNSSCNLASLNLMKFLTPATDEEPAFFDSMLFSRAVENIILAMDISVSFADFPTEKIASVSRAYRQLGIGYSNLGSLLMATGHAYDSPGGRALAGAVTALMTGASYRRSAELARDIRPYDGFARNREAHLGVLSRHAHAAKEATSVDGLDFSVWEKARNEWTIAVSLAKQFGVRNAQVSLLAPTGTISFMMDCDTTGVEPDFALVKHKKLVGGGSMEIVNQTVPAALAALNYTPEQRREIVGYVAEHGHVVGAPFLAAEHYEVFDCAVGERSISPMGHLTMMGAVQPFLSGAISKTINMPSDATVESIAGVYLAGWELGLKAVAIYRDGSKGAQPLSTKKSDPKPAEAVPEAVAETLPDPAGTEQVPHTVRPTRERLPAQRQSLTTSFDVGGAQGYLTASRYPEGGLGEIFLKMGKQGSTLSGVMDAFSIAVSIGLQYGIPLETFVEKFQGTQFEPRGMTRDEDVRISTSVMDYAFRRLALDFLPPETCEALGVISAEERAARVAREGDTHEVDLIEPMVAASTVDRLVEHGILAPTPPRWAPDAPLCTSCGVVMVRAGVCWSCSSCGATSGCS